MGITAQQVNEILLEEVKYKRGYDMDQVDDLLDRIALTLYAYEQEDLSREVISSEQVTEALSNINRTENQPGYSSEATTSLIERVLEQLAFYEAERSQEYLLQQEAAEYSYTPELQAAGTVVTEQRTTGQTNNPQGAEPPTPLESYSPTVTPQEVTPEVAAPPVEQDTLNPEVFAPKTLIELLSIVEKIAEDKNPPAEFLVLEHEGVRFGVHDVTLKNNNITLYAKKHAPEAPLVPLFDKLNSLYDYESNKLPLLEEVSVEIEGEPLSVRYAYSHMNRIIVVVS